jgi:hypothetical protein
MRKLAALLLLTVLSTATVTSAEAAGLEVAVATSAPVVAVRAFAVDGLGKTGNGTWDPARPVGLEQTGNGTWDAIAG